MVLRWAMIARSLVLAVLAGALAPAAATAATHTVTPGETLSGIAFANNLRTSIVAAANGLSPDAQVVAGTKLTVPLPGAAPAAATPAAPSAAAASASPAAAGYRVQP